MSEPLRAYEPTEKGRELIALLFPLPHHEREKNIQEYWKQYPQEKAALLDGFQFMLQEIAESRSGGTNDCLNLPKPLVEVIIKQMVTSENFLAYDSGHDFLQGLAQYTPPLLGNIKDIKEALQRFSKPEPAEYSAAAEEKIKQVCKVAEDAYDQIAKILHSIRNSQKVIDMYQDVNSGISLIDVKLAKETFLESKKIFLESGKKIAAGMEYIYGGYQQFPDQLQIKKAYIKYLAKLLASREARNPPENYILKLAEGPFDFSLPDFEPTDKQLQYGKTKYSIKKEYSNLLQQDVNRLEARYRKRKLTTMLKQKALKSTIIKSSKQLSRLTRPIFGLIFFLPSCTPNTLLHLATISNVAP